MTPATRRAAWVAALALAAAFAGTGAAQDVPGLEQRARAFYELLERGQRDRAAAVAPDLERDLAAAATALGAEQDRMRDGVTERDEDVEALYASPRWREVEVRSLVVAYHLAWVRYQAAQLTGEGPRRRKLLEQAVDGFSQFTAAPDVPEIYAESLYGRGLAYLDLGQYRDALVDLEAAAGQARTGAKAKAAIEEVKRRQGGGKAQAPAPPPENDPEVLAGKLGEQLAATASGDATVEKQATALARGLAARGGEWPARIARLVAEKLGDGTPAGVRTSYGLWLLGQLAVDRGRCADVAPLAAAGAAVHDAGRPRHRAALLYLDAGCRLNARRSREAAEAFGVLLKEFPQAEQARDAAYYRFRALDVARVDHPALEPELDAALQGYLERWPRGEGAAEAHFLLGERLRARGDCPRAAAEYAQVADGAYAARARLGALECRVAALSPKTPTEERAALARDLAAFVQASPARGADEAQVGRAALMGALVASGVEPPQHETVVVLLDGFEQRYPAAKDLLPRVLETRLAARVALGQVAPAARDLDALLAAGGPPGGTRTLAKVGKQLAARAEQGPSAERAAALAAARSAWTAVVARDGTPADRIVLADLELRGGDAAAARRLYDAVLAAQPDSAEALRGAARAATVAGDADGALAYWRRVVEGSPPGGTAWYEARVAQVELLARSGRGTQACDVLRQSRGRSTSAGGDVLARRLAALEPDVCR